MDIVSKFGGLVMGQARDKKVPIRLPHSSWFSKGNGHPLKGKKKIDMKKP